MKMRYFCLTILHDVNVYRQESQCHHQAVGGRLVGLVEGDMDDHVHLTILFSTPFYMGFILC